VTTTDFSNLADVASSLVIQADGKIVLAGTENAKFDLNGLTSGNYFPLADSDSQFALARYTTTGHLDPTFGSGGKVTTNFGPRADGAAALALAPGGKLVAAGVETIRPENPGVTPGESLYAVAEYNSNGTLAAKAARHYSSTTDFGDSALAVAVQSNGDVILAGEDAITSTKSAVVVTRLTPSLAVDSSFGTKGVTITNVVSPSEPYKKEGVDGIRLQSDGKIIVVGAARITANNTAWAVLRYTNPGAAPYNAGGLSAYVVGVGTGVPAPRLGGWRPRSMAGLQARAEVGSPITGPGSVVGAPQRAVAWAPRRRIGATGGSVAGRDGLPDRGSE
jgi:uncharacterized delta-60 repeat protein